MERKERRGGKGKKRKGNKKRKEKEREEGREERNLCSCDFSLGETPHRPYRYFLLTTIKQTIIAAIQWKATRKEYSIKAGRLYIYKVRIKYRPTLYNGSYNRL